MTDTPTKMLYVVCWMKRGTPTPARRTEKASSWQEAARLAYEAGQQFPQLVHWVEPAPTTIPDPRDALVVEVLEELSEVHESDWRRLEAHRLDYIAALEQEIAERQAAIKQMREEK